MYKLFAVGFSRETDELQLDELFSRHGLVKTLTIVRDQQSGVSKGYAFVQMLDQFGAERAIRHLDGFRIDDRTLHVRYADQQQEKTTEAQAPVHPLNKRRAPDTKNRVRPPRGSGN